MSTTNPTAGTLSLQGVYTPSGWVPLRQVREWLNGDEPCHTARVVARVHGIPVDVVKQIERGETWLDEVRTWLEQRAEAYSGTVTRLALDEAAVDVGNDVAGVR